MGPMILMGAGCLKLYPISSADNIIVREEGCAREKGRHTELLNAGGLYAHMWAERERAHGWKLRSKAA